MTKLCAAAVAIEEPARWLLGRATAVEAKIGRVFVEQGRTALGDLRNIPRYVLHTLVGVLVVVGLLSLWEARGDGKLPSMSPLAPSAGLDPYAFSSAGCVAEQTTAAVRWKGLAPALAILDRVNPAVAGWVREKHAIMPCSSAMTTGPRASRPSPWPSTTCSGIVSS